MQGHYDNPGRAIRKPVVAVMIVPTGLGCSIGGHAGDATPAARLLASVCDVLILHPNVVNASDINEAPENSLYVEGSALDRFLSGEINLRPVRSNRLLVVVNEATPLIVNAVNAARATLGASTVIEKLKQPLTMVAKFEGERATGDVVGYSALIDQVKNRDDFDALAVITKIEVPQEVAQRYFEKGGVNPWGGVEAKASRMISYGIGKPVAHAPVDDMLLDDVVVDFRMSAEMVSRAYLFCVLKGLHRAPALIPNMQPSSRHGLICDLDVDCLVSPMNCWGRPHRACRASGIPVIVVGSNVCSVPRGLLTPDEEEVVWVHNYREAAGRIAQYSCGIEEGALL